MSNRIQHKRSSVAGRRPDGRYLEPGELALNTNASDPGVYFELNDGTIAKAGPTHVSLTAPSTEVGYGVGETWFDTGNLTFNTYSAEMDRWVATLSPLFGGDKTLMFVGTSFAEASDSLSNDGSARPFATLNRACIEVARRSILPGRADKAYNHKFVIVLLPGENIVENTPGLGREDFDNEVGTFTSTSTLTPEQLTQFNPVEGGIILPRGTSIVGIDQHKTVIRPTYYPDWAIDSDDPTPASTILHWTGNSFLHNLTFLDKKSDVSVTAISGDDDDDAVLTSLFPHGFRAVERDENGLIAVSDTVRMTYPSGAAQSYEGEQTIPEQNLLVEPLDQYRFRLLASNGATYILRRELPKNPATKSNPAEYITLTHSNKTHHRLSAVSWVNADDLSDFYYKTQRAFGEIDAAGISLDNTVNNAQIANPGEIQIIAEATTIPTSALDKANEQSSLVEQVTVRSNWGMCGLKLDGDRVSGFRSARISGLNVTSLQNDPRVYEVYYNNEWISLHAAAAAYNQLIVATDAQAMNYLVSIATLDEIRFYNRAAVDIEGQTDKSSGLTDTDTDARHYAILAENLAEVQVKDADVLGTAVHFWTKSGARMLVSGCTSSLGGEALRSEGFAGIGTAAGAIASDRGFNILGIRRPVNISASQLSDTANHDYIYLNASIASLDAAFSTIVLAEAFDPKSLGPYTLRPGSVIWVRDEIDGNMYSGVLADPSITADGLGILLESAGDNITGRTATNLSVPFIRRFVDPRPEPQRDYHLWINNTNSQHRPPAVGSVLRFDHTPNAGVSTLLVSGRQLDPGVNGGWNHVFRVSGSSTKADGDRPSFSNESRSKITSLQNYYISLDLCDSFKPWLGEVNGKFYSRGQYVTKDSVAFYAGNSELSSGAGTSQPASNAETWERGKTSLVCQPVDEAWVPVSDYARTADPDTDDYSDDTEVYSYARGISTEADSYSIRNFIDRDNGTATLGLLDSGDLTIASHEIVDPAWLPSKAAMTRFLTLLGYTDSEISSWLRPAKWSERNIVTTEASVITEPSGEGYAIGKGPWPVEFCRGSSITCTGHSWLSCGYLSYSKGLPAYQGGELTDHQRFEAMTSEQWGGSILASGVTGSREAVTARLVRTDAAGNLL